MGIRIPGRLLEMGIRIPGRLLEMGMLPLSRNGSPFGTGPRLKNGGLLQNEKKCVTVETA
jgi:hypothetical protein